MKKILIIFSLYLSVSANSQTIKIMNHSTTQDIRFYFEEIDPTTCPGPTVNNTWTGLGLGIFLPTTSTASYGVGTSGNIFTKCGFLDPATFIGAGLPYNVIESNNANNCVIVNGNSSAIIYTGGSSVSVTWTEYTNGDVDVDIH